MPVKSCKKVLVMEEVLLKDGEYYMVKIKNGGRKRFIQWLPKWKIPLALIRKFEKEVKKVENSLRKRRLDQRNEKKE